MKFTAAVATAILAMASLTAAAPVPVDDVILEKRDEIAARGWGKISYYSSSDPPQKRDEVAARGWGRISDYSVSDPQEKRDEVAARGWGKISYYSSTDPPQKRDETNA